MQAPRGEGWECGGLGLWICYWDWVALYLYLLYKLTPFNSYALEVARGGVLLLSSASLALWRLRSCHFAQTDRQGRQTDRRDRQTCGQTDENVVLTWLRIVASSEFAVLSSSVPQVRVGVRPHDEVKFQSVSPSLSPTILASRAAAAGESFV